MALAKISVRLDNESYGKLLKLAQLERKTITELVRELIELGLAAKDESKENSGRKESLQRLDALTKLAMKTAKAAAKAQFLASMSV